MMTPCMVLAVIEGSKHMARLDKEHSILPTPQCGSVQRRSPAMARTCTNQHARFVEYQVSELRLSIVFSKWAHVELFKRIAKDI